MRKEAANWLASAQYDLETAEHMFSSGRYIYTVFMCHLAVEKVTKAAVEESTGGEPPRSHDLQYLLELAGLRPDQETEGFIAELTNLSVATRYPVDFERALSDFSMERAEAVLSKTKETFEWIKKQMA
jgi:HEPN domain-containing protein